MATFDPIREKRIETARRLLALAAGAGTEGEAATALAQAQAIMAKYEIEEAEVEDRPLPPLEAPAHDLLWTTPGDFMPRWAWSLVHAVTQGRPLVPYATHARSPDGKARRAVKCAGQPSEIDQARDHFRFLVAQVDRLTEEAYRERGGGLGLSWKYSFREGCAARLRERLQAEVKLLVSEARASASSAALARVDARAALAKQEVDAFVRRTIRLKYGGVSDRAVDGDAYGAGRRAGDRADVSRPATTRKLNG